MNVKQQNLLTLIAIAALFLAPIAASYYLNSIGWQPDKKKNRGHLLKKAEPMVNKSFVLPNGKQLSVEGMKHTWALVYVGGNTCKQSCETRLEELRRVHVSLGKNQKRVRLLYLDSADVSNDEKMTERFDKFEILAKPVDSTTAWKQQFDSMTGQETSGMVFIVDPLGNAIMYYLAEDDASGIRKDMGRLLHVSRVG